MNERLSIKFGSLISHGTERKNGFLNVNNGVVTSIENNPLSGNEIVDFEDCTIIPGLIDIHTHGYGGVDAMDGDYEQIAEWALNLLKHGVTGFVPASVSASNQEIVEFVRKIGYCMKNQGDLRSEILGARLEGPFISLKKSGAHRKDLIRDPTIGEISGICKEGKGVLRIVDMAPELNGALDAANYLSESDVLVSMGHSDADYETVQKFMNAGFHHFTHFYNAMSPFQHRSVGMVGAGLLSENSELEIIADLFHISHEAIEMCVRNRGWENMILITDSIAATGMKDGLYNLGGLRVEMKDGKCHLENTDTIAGSTLTLDKAMHNLISIGYPLQNFIDSLTLLPAKFLGITDRGKLDAGFRADFCVLDKNYKVKKTYRKGKELFST